MYEYGVAYLGILLGCLLRIILPYLQKDVPFDRKYVASLISAIIISVAVASNLISSVQIPEDAQSLVLLFSSTFLQGWGTTNIANKVGIDWRR